MTRRPPTSTCSRRNPCGMAACDDCHLIWRNDFRKRLRQLLRGHDNVAYSTIILTDPALRQKKLKRIHPKAVVQQFRMMLRRLGLGHLTLVGLLEVDWNELAGCWEPHFHLLVLDPDANFTSLKKHLKTQDPHRGDRDKQVYRPVVTEFLVIEDDKSAVIGYITKMRPMRKWPYHAKGKRRYRKARLRGKQKRAAEAWLSRPPRDFAFLQNVRLEASGFRLLRPLSGKSSKSTVRSINRPKGGVYKRI